MRCFPIRLTVVQCVALSAIYLGMILVGCTPSATPKSDTKSQTKSTTKEKDPHDHDHAHHGPNGGHLIEVGDEEFHIEWTHDDTGKVNFYVLDSEAKDAVQITMAALEIVTKVGDKSETYKADAVSPTAEGKTSEFAVESKALLGVLETLSEATTAMVKELDVNGKKFTNLKIEHDEHGH